MSSLLRLPPLTAALKHPSPKLAPARPFRSSSLQKSTGLWPIPFRSPQAMPNGFNLYRRSRFVVPLSVSATSGNSGSHEELNLEWMVGVRKMFDSLPQPVKIFPWGRLLGIYQNFIFGLALFVAKYLCIPLLAISSLSEMSYCAHERKMGVIPIPFLLGFALAGIASNAAVDLSPELKEVENPWHLIMIAAFFLLLKLPGPYYPYWGRLCIPHFANGGLWRTAWLAFMWHRRRHETTGVTTQASVV
ncbi:uncharacterized protein [Typha angustifolia]|uniref:uncharacterized protein n=1 Tax=Typha angustifolia TaxID=59011 RepID=UPI003C305F97